MKRLAVFLLVVGLAAPVFAASPIISKSPGDRGLSWDMESALTIAAATVCNPPGGCAVSDFARAEIVPGIVHYRAVVQVGPGTYDRIGIHRVVRENRPGYPMKSSDRIFLQHGSSKNFVGMFLPGLYSPTTPGDFGLAVYLASNKVDVWGIDQRWAIVPSNVTDCGFTQQWGIQDSILDLHAALRIARETRRLMDGSDDRFNLLGYSSGGLSGYGYLNYEAQLPMDERHVQGYVAADITYKTTDPALNAFACWVVDYYTELYEQGFCTGCVCEESVFPIVGELARTDPEGDSPLLPGLNNLQAAIGFGSLPTFGDTPFHYLAGVFDPDGTPAGLQYLETDAWLDFLLSGAPYEGLFGPGGIEGWTVVCNMADSPFDDHLAEVTVPILNWGAAGGLAPYGVDTFPWLGSRDVTSVIVETWPAADVLLDFGHIDLFIAENAPQLAWAPLLDWVRHHR